MLFHIEHTTEYEYSAPATESFSEFRLRPRDSLRQRVTRHSTRIDPPAPVESHVDYFGNHVETVSIPFRHHRLSVTGVCDVETKTFNDALTPLRLSVAEARQIFAERRRELYDYTRPTALTPSSGGACEIAAEFFGPAATFSDALLELNSHLFHSLTYKPGATDAGTTVEEFLRTREGVCQDFAHLMIAICRFAGIPARYVSGYIETDPIPGKDGGPALIGATATHAWVEVFCPNGFWVGLDPTNNILEGDRHVQVGVGRDYADVPPLKGIFKGSKTQRLGVRVRMSRLG
jgi:transglutaminase-like putative cysteine protease